MSQSDWKFTLYDANTFISGVYGNAVQHASMSNPITHSGDWCRQFIPANNNVASQVSIVPTSSLDLSSSSGYEYGYAYSVRTWVRQSANVLNLIFKGHNDLDVSLNYSSDPISNPPYGYVLQIYGNQLQLYCSSNSRNGFSDSLEPYHINVGYRVQNFYSLDSNQWKGLRLDVSPILGAYDKITVYTAERNSPDTWTQRYSVNIPNTKLGAYIPWANNPNGDGANAAGKGCMGIGFYVINQSSPIFIDQFEVYKERVI